MQKNVLFKQKSFQGWYLLKSKVPQKGENCFQEPTCIIKI